MNDAVRRAVAILRAGGLVAFPTETVYGLGADASNPDAIERLYAAKRRPADHPVIVHFADARRAFGWAREVPEAAHRLAARFWPGPLTMILKRAPQVGDYVTGGQDTVGLRVPSHPVARELLEQFGGGVAAPSANVFGRVSPTSAAHVREDLGAEADCVLEGGSSEVGIESTIVDLSGAAPALLRPGHVRAEQLEAVLGCRLGAKAAVSPRHPGGLERHYAPRTPAILVAPHALDARIARIVATNNEIYMLNATDGSILRAFLTGDGAGGGYQLDANFSCQPGPYGDFIVSELVDLALLPRGNALNADLLAMDANGNVIYCASGERPAARALVAPDSHWGRPQALTVENGNLYVLDPLNNAVWIYFGEDYSYAESPRFFFGAQVPNLRRMLDLAVEGEDLFLINEDGRMAICRFSDDIDNPSTCEDPAQYTDTRPGREAGPQVAGANFEQIQIGEPPQPSLYMLDPVARAVYRLSLSLGLDTQFQSLVPLPEGLATAFAITPNRAILLAIENDVYIGFIPSDP